MCSKNIIYRRFYMSEKNVFDDLSIKYESAQTEKQYSEADVVRILQVLNQNQAYPAPQPRLKNWSENTRRKRKKNKKLNKKLKGKGKGKNKGKKKSSVFTNIGKKMLERAVHDLYDDVRNRRK